ncbi:hypothetical protein ABD86_25945 [Paenibacillus alvei]|nr:hypothetical protein [Paenibacillus alvei]MBG9747213.1 hypothetical protein [Paenibacillus alvei]
MVVLQKQQKPILIRSMQLKRNFSHTINPLIIHNLKKRKVLAMDGELVRKMMDCWLKFEPLLMSAANSMIQALYKLISLGISRNNDSDR